jgi:hypothetical protein
MNWITGLLLLIGLLVLLRIIFLLRKPSRQEKHTIRLEEAPSDNNSNPNLPALLFFLILILLAAVFAVQFIIGRLQ